MSVPARDSAPLGAIRAQRLGMLLAAALDAQQLELERAVLRAAAANSQLADLYVFSCLKASQAMETSGRLRETTTNLTPQAEAGLQALEQDFVEDVRAVFGVTSTAFQQSLVQALAPESPQQARARHAGAFLEGLCDVVTLGLSKRAREG